jgi:hypothetical protein
MKSRSRSPSEHRRGSSSSSPDCLFHFFYFNFHFKQLEHLSHQEYLPPVSHQNTQHLNSQ